ncbi:glutathione S-transferase family protein [Sedimentitalea sp. HM32M-2]|uniref:glutathione S-transferase family protein n=1 Tax=Sedimentitalea sp. HM32M-2 TaxID=3351566 RepID=UPI00363EEAEC
MNTPYRLYYAPDNASLIIRLALEEMRLPYDTVLVDRARRAQRDPAYLRLNPNGLIPVLETPQGAVFETGAILLWLSDTHGALAPAPDDPQRAAYLTWLFCVSNTLHAELRMSFYPHLYAGADPAAQAQLLDSLQPRLRQHLTHLDQVAAAAPSWLDARAPSGLAWYLACLLRWTALYPAYRDRTWFSLAATPHLHALLSGLESRPATQAAIAAEGLGATPFTSPRYATPPEGSAT